jgi:two-component system sensor histidine kinase HydH
MDERQREEWRQRRRQRRRARHQRGGMHDHEVREDPRRALTPEERALREARLEANRRIGFFAHLVPYLAVVTFLLLVAGFRAAFIVALAWGIGLATHWFGALVAPRLRKQIIEREVRKRVADNVTRERRTLVDAHTRHVEELAAGVAHEIRNPITAAKSLVQQMGEDPTANDNVEYANVALAELERVEKSISHLLRFAREEDVSLAELRLDEVVDSALETLRDRIQGLGVTVERDVAALNGIRGDAEKLRRVVINLFGNALDAFAESGTPGPRLEITAGSNLAGNEAWLRVRDNGPGMEAEKLERIWSPFYTSKQSGTGLGLALSRKVIEAHHGSIEASSEPGHGTEVVVTLPRRAAVPEPTR